MQKSTLRLAGDNYQGTQTKDWGTNCVDCSRYKTLGEVCVIEHGKRFLWEYCRDFQPEVELPEYNELMQSVKKDIAIEREKARQKKKRERTIRKKEREDDKMRKGTVREQLLVRKIAKPKTVANIPPRKTSQKNKGEKMSSNQASESSEGVVSWRMRNNLPSVKVPLSQGLKNEKRISPKREPKKLDEVADNLPHPLTDHDKLVSELARRSKTSLTDRIKSNKSQETQSV